MSSWNKVIREGNKTKYSSLHPSEHQWSKTFLDFSKSHEMQVMLTSPAIQKHGTSWVCANKNKFQQSEASRDDFL